MKPYEYTPEDYKQIDKMPGGINAPQNAWHLGQKKLQEWLNEPCEEHPLDTYEAGEPTIFVTWRDDGIYYNHRKDCLDCWQQLLKDFRIDKP